MLLLLSPLPPLLLLLLSPQDFATGVDHLVIFKVAQPEAQQQVLDALTSSISHAQPVQVTAGVCLITFILTHLCFVVLVVEAA